MHATLPIKSLSDGLKRVAPAIPAKGTPTNRALPVLTSARLEAVAGALTILATSLDFTIRTTVAADVHEDGVALAGLSELRKAATGKGNIELRGDGDAVIATNGITQRVPARGGLLVDFPNLGFADDTIRRGEWVDFDLDVLRSVLPAVWNDGREAASPAEDKPVLRHVYFGGMDVVATDTHRMHVVRGVKTFDEPTLVSGLMLKAVLGSAKGPVQMRRNVRPMKAGDDIVSVDMTDGTTVWTGKHLHGSFVNYQQLIVRPGSDHDVDFPRPAFEEKLAEFADVTKGTPIPVRIGRAVDGGLRLWAAGNGPVDMATGEAKPLAEAFVPGHAPDFTVAFHADRLRQLVAGLRTCTFTVVDSLKPAVISEMDAAGRQHLRLLMPVRIN